MILKEHIHPCLIEFKDGRGRPPLITDYDFFCAVLFVMRTGIAWRDLPTHYGCWHTVYTRFKRWSTSGWFWKLLQETGKKGRRTGLGFTALSDAVAALGHQIDSDEALEHIDTILRKKCLAEFDSSVDMAIERGSFEGFDPAIEKTSEFVGMLKEEFPELYGRMMLNGRRNISISTVAPTGSLSMLKDGCMPSPGS